MTEADAYTVKTYRGTRSGFYRDAQVFVRDDFTIKGFRIFGGTSGAFVRLRAAAGGQVFFEALNGYALEQYDDIEEVWVPCLKEGQDPSEEHLAKFGNVYRPIGSSNFFFSIQNM